mmetsp:Transcript_70102/g.131039  ORF Transcript_70102/g.131039 Transcript_70102/m.131039 type:complete len:174 (+) Transcript_70102:58-579(+)
MAEAQLVVCLAEGYMSDVVCTSQELHDDQPVADQGNAAPSQAASRSVDDTSSQRIAARKHSSMASSRQPPAKGRPVARNASWTFGSPHLLAGCESRQGLKNCPSSCGSLCPIPEDQPVQSDTVDEKVDDSRHATPMFLPGIRDHSTQIPGSVDDAPDAATACNRPRWAFGCTS